VSYYVRESPYYDTLLQMARWFGYREWYVDLTRLWTTDTLMKWFRDLALREEELRDQVLVAERNQLSPIEVGYRIRSHPAMMVTAQNRMGAGSVDELSFAGSMIQTSRFRLQERDWLTGNLEAAKRLLSGLGEPGEDPSGVPRWDGIDWNIVLAFLDDYESVQSRTTFDSGAAGQYIRAQAEGHHELTSWTIAVATQSQRVDRLEPIDLDIEGDRNPVNAIERSRLKRDRSSIGVLTNPARKDGAIRRGDEEIGLTDGQILSARQRLADGDFERIRDALLAERPVTEGLLVLYPISRYSKARSGSSDRDDLFDDPEADGQDVIGVALGFPPSDSGATIEYVAQPPTGDDE
jgi:hypothetical protein